jgi:hypothetical protein
LALLRRCRHLRLTLATPPRPAQHLTALLAASDNAVVDAALAALAALARRSVSRGTRWHDSFELGRARLPPLLQSLARAHTVRAHRARRRPPRCDAPTPVRSFTLNCTFLCCSVLASPPKGMSLLLCATGAEPSPEAAAAARSVHFEFYAQPKARGRASRRHPGTPRRLRRVRQFGAALTLFREGALALPPRRRPRSRRARARACTHARISHARVRC